MVPRPIMFLIKSSIIIGVCFALVMSLTGCAGGNSLGNTKAPGSEQESKVKDADTALDHYSYTFQPHVISKEYSLIFGADIEAVFFSFCDTILSCGKTFPCSSDERFHQLLGIARTCFPLAEAVIDKDNIKVENGICYLAYLSEGAELTEAITSFQSKVTDVITEAIPFDEPDCIKAMELYTAVARKDTYDDSTTLDDFLSIKPYRAIMEDTGICQEIAGEYIYYLLQVGINAIPCSSLSRDQSEAHEWVLVDLDGYWYHVDPTLALQYPDSLCFFGMNDKQREYYGDLPPAQFTYAESDRPDRSRYIADDRRFADFWTAESYQIDHKNRTIHVKEINTGEEHEYPYPLP